MTNNIQITDKAITAIKKQSATYLRIGVRGSGCSGFSYAFKYEETAKETDHIFEFDGIKILVDPKSIEFLDGATLDYHNSLMKAQFKINNPNAKSSCGCGKSFSVK